MNNAAKNEIYEFETLWTVENFLMYPALGKREYLESAPFSSNKANGIVVWVMDMYLNGCETFELEGFVALFLKIQHLANDVEGIQASFSFAIIDANGKKQKTGKAGKCFFRNDGHVFGLLAFVSREELEKPGNDLLHNGHLTVACHIEGTVKYKVSECKTSSLSVDTKCDFSSETLGQFGQLSEDKIILMAFGTAFVCYKRVLFARSSYFRAMFSDVAGNVFDLSKVMDATVLNDLVNFIYHGKTTNLYETCYTLYHVADVYGLHILKNLCEEELIKKITSENAENLLVFAAKNGAIKLLNLAAKRIFVSSQYHADP